MTQNAPDFDLEFKEAISPEPAKEPVKKEEIQTDPVIPEKLKGKSLYDVIDMYSNAEKKISEQGAQLHELRTLSDQILGLKKETAKKEVKVTAEDLLNDPGLTLNQAIDNSTVAERQTATEDRLAALEKSIGQREFESKHSTFVEDVQNPEFRNWVMANRARQGLLANLNNNFDFEAGTALWDMWEEHKTLTTQPKVDKRETVRAATTVRGGPAESARKPVYSRAKLLELQAKAVRGDRIARAKWEDPTFQKEYQEAYAEGRVK